jgi:hypothetical protein
MVGYGMVILYLERSYEKHQNWSINFYAKGYLNNCFVPFLQWRSDWIDGCV